ncbi:MAG: hypothetical protein ACKOQ3_11445 [Novosphingobium sp.]
MNRLVIALLALLAGLVAPVAPAHARLGSGTNAEAGAVESVERVSRICTIAASVVDVPACRTDRRDKPAGRVRSARPRVFIPTVYFGPDRALE